MNATESSVEAAKDASPPAYSHTRMVRIQWGDCDPAGIIFNARYFEIFDASTAALFESALGINKRQMLETYGSAGIPLIRTEARFVKPPRFGDDVSVESTIAFGRSSFRVEHRVRFGDQLCAEASELRVWVVPDASGGIKSTPVPLSVLEKFASRQRQALR
jgi:4-hydroxybenzoyl-CoA thioesterase